MNPSLIADRAETLRRIEIARRHGVEDVAVQSMLYGENGAQFQSRLIAKLAVRELGGAFSFRRMFDGLVSNKLDGLERESLQEAARTADVSYDPTRPIIPWAAFSGSFTRDLIAASAGTGGYLVGTDVGEAADILRPFSVTARLGVQFIERLKGNLQLPKTNTKATGYWLADETQQITPSQTVIGGVSFTPKTGGGFVEYSRQLNLQASVETYIRRELLRTVGTLLDAAVINGGGHSGQPLGLLNTPGIGTQSGTSLAYSGVCAMKRTVAAADAPDDDISFLAAPATRELLEARERAAGSGFIWDNNTVASQPARVSTDVPTATLICGAWSSIAVGLWGVGFQLELNPFEATAFKIGKIQARLLVQADVGVVHPTAFNVSTGIT